MKFSLQILLLLGCAGLGLHPFAFSEARQPYPFTQEREWDCEDQTEKALRSLDELLATQPQRIDALLLREALGRKSPDLLQQELQAFLEGGEMPTGEAERLLWADRLFALRSIQWEKIAALLDFESPDPLTEAYRRWLKADLSTLSGEAENVDYDHLIRRVAETLNYPQPDLIYLIWRSSPTASHLRRNLELWEGDIENLPESDPMHLALQALRLWEENSFPQRPDPTSAAARRINGLFKRAHELCPSHPHFLLESVNWLNYLWRHQEAFDQGQAFIERSPLYHPLLDEQMMEAALGSHRPERALEFHQRAWASRTYLGLDESQTRELERLGLQLQKEASKSRRDRWILIGMATILALFLGSALKNLLFQRRKTIDSLIEDKEAYEQALKGVRQQSEEESDMVTVGHFSSGHGFSDSDLIDMVMALGNEGIRATYKTSTVAAYMSTKNNYNLVVPVKDVERAKEVLKKWLER